MQALDLTTLIPRVHTAAKANGWWDTPRNAGEALMLVVSELSEALEADRTGNNDSQLLDNYFDRLGPLNALENQPLTAFRPDVFKSLVKDSVGDELADAYIRLCDYAGGFAVDILFWQPERESLMKFTTTEAVPENMGQALLPIVQDVLNMNTAKKVQSELALSGALVKLEMLCHAKGIDLATHIDLKLAFNKTRGVRHGNKAY